MSNDSGWSAAADASGNVIVTGQFDGTINFGGGSLTSAGGGDIFIAKFDAAGAHQWSRRFGDASQQVAMSVATDASGNVLITGEFGGTVNFGGSNLTSAGGLDVFVAKFNAAGTHQWSQRFGGVFQQAGNSVAADGSGNVIIAGQFQGTVNFGGGNLNTAGEYDIFVAKFDAFGVHQWSRRFGDLNDFQFGLGVAADASGNVILTGQFIGAVDFGGGVINSNDISVDIFVAKYNALGVHQWSRGFGGLSHGDRGSTVSTDASGNVIIAGDFADTVNFGGSDLTTAGDLDIFVAKFNSGGVHQWSQRFGDVARQECHSVTTDAAGNAAITGSFLGTVDFGGGSLVSAGSNDIFIAKFNSGGVHQWSQRFGDASYQDGASIAADVSGNVIVTGALEGTANFGGNNLVSAGGLDIFLAKFSVLSRQPVIASVVDVGNDQGRRVRIRFSRSGVDDAAASPPIVQYEVFRRNDAVALAAAAMVTESRTREQILDLGWVYAGSAPAHGAAEYLMDAATDADSTVATGQHYSVFFVRAATQVPTRFYDSPPDSGYSLDNLAPGTPTSLAYQLGALTWDESSAADFDYFTVYGSNTSSFATAVLIGHTVAPFMNVLSSPYAYYFATATDFSGNEGGPATLQTPTATDGPPRSHVLSISSYPNPFNPETTIRYTVPSRGWVRMSVYDVRGTHVVTLVDEAQEAGAYTMRWGGTDGRGQIVGSGVYFARVAHPSGTRNDRLVLLK